MVRSSTNYGRLRKELTFFVLVTADPTEVLLSPIRDPPHYAVGNSDSSGFRNEHNTVYSGFQVLNPRVTGDQVLKALLPGIKSQVFEPLRGPYPL